MEEIAMALTKLYAWKKVSKAANTVSHLYTIVPVSGRFNENGFYKDRILIKIWLCHMI